MLRVISNLQQQQSYEFTQRQKGESQGLVEGMTAGASKHSTEKISRVSAVVRARRKGPRLHGFVCEFPDLPPW